MFSVSLGVAYMAGRSSEGEEEETSGTKEHVVAVTGQKKRSPDHLCLDWVFSNQHHHS